MKASLKIWQKGLILALLPFAFNLIWIGLFFNSVERASTWINKAESQGVVIVEVANSIALLSTIFFDLADYVDTAGSAEVKTKLKTDWQQLNDCYARLDGLTKDDPEISAKLNRFAASLQEHMANSKIMDGAFAASTFNKELADTLPEKYCKDSALDLKELIDLLSSRQERFRTILESEELERDKTRLIANLGLLANIILAALIAVFFQKNLTARISRLENNARSLADRSRTFLPLEGNDELQQLDQELLRAQESLAQEAAFRQSFLKIMANNIQVPLLSSRDAIGRLEESGFAANDKKARQLKSLRQATATGLRLVADMLLIDNLDTGSLPLHYQPVQMQSLVAESIDLLQNLAAVKKLEIINTTPPQVVEADQGRILQVITNLLANAIKFSPVNGTITISLQMTAQKLRLSINDQGPGLEKAVRAKLFQKFYQSAEGKKAGGSGLGLAICKLIVEAHDGIIGTDSSPGQGSTFWFELPVKRT